MEIKSGTSFLLQFFAEERTEPASPQKRRKEREEGRVAKSQDLGAAIVLLAGLFVISLSGRWLFGLLTSYVGETMSFIGSDEIGRDGWFMSLALEAIKRYGLVLFPISVACAIGALMITVAQVGFVITAKPLIPKFDRMNPISGMKRIFSLRSLVELLKGLLKALLFLLVLYMALRKDLAELLSAIRFPLVQGVASLGRHLWNLSMKMAFLLLAIAIFDWAYQKWEFERSIKMSKQELKEEYKQMEGDPQIRSKIRQKQRELAQGRMMSEVPKADVVITNPTTLANAIQYDRDIMDVPLLLAKGKGNIAHRIREIAAENDIPVVENKPLAWSLFEGVEIGEEIPEELYRGVAEVLAYVYRLGKK